MILAASNQQQPVTKPGADKPDVLVYIIYIIRRFMIIDLFFIFALDFLPSLFYISNSQLSGNNSAVECNLAKVEVAGSNPVSRSIRNPRVVLKPPFFLLFRLTKLPGNE